MCKVKKYCRGVTMTRKICLKYTMGKIKASIHIGLSINNDE
jgi:hypothetical protein